ncbi:MAG: alpha/beta hydrolase [Flavobacteriales bacterium]|nr:alpha/beta hydrolase [Flavobacteriales bacterium]
MDHSIGLHRQGRLTLAYHTYGEGSRTILAFHGFGQRARVFEPLLGPLQDTRFIAFDLFFHGDSDSENSSIDPLQCLTVEEWRSFLIDFIKEQNVSKVSLMGYSMGARLVLSAAQEIPSEYIDEVMLLAPDGFMENQWHRFATRNSLGRMAFKKLPAYRGVLNRLGRILVRTPFLDEKLLKVALENTRSEERCTQLYNTWTFLRCIRPEVERIGRELELRSIPIIVHLGRFDKLIDAAKVLEWSYLNRNPQHALVHEVGHDLLKSRLADSIMKADPSLQ